MGTSRGLYISYRPVSMVDIRYIEPRSSGYRPRTLVLYIDYRPGDRSITYTYIYGGTCAIIVAHATYT